MGKTDAHLKHFWSNDKRNTELSFTNLSKKQNIPYMATTNYGLIYFRKKKRLCYKFTRCERLLDLHGECLQEEPMNIQHKFRNDKTYVT